MHSSTEIRQMKISIADIKQANVKDIPEPCKACLYWENPNAVEQGKQKPTLAKKGRLEAEKASWFLETLEEFGNCGKILYVDTKPAGYAQYSTANRFPNTREYASKKLEIAAENVAFISCLYISNKNLRGKGLGVKLLDDVIADLQTRGFKAVETFVSKNSANNPSGPIELYMKKGFHVKEDINSDFALVRIDL